MVVLLREFYLCLDSFHTSTVLARYSFFGTRGRHILTTFLRPENCRETTSDHTSSTSVGTANHLFLDSNLSLTNKPITLNSKIDFLWRSADFYIFSWLFSLYYFWPLICCTIYYLMLLFCLSKSPVGGNKFQKTATRPPSITEKSSNYSLSVTH